VARPVVELLFPQGATSRIPIVAVTGTEGRTSTSRMIADILSSAGRKVGLANSDGMYIGGAHRIQREMNGPDSARTVLRNPAIETAVLEIGYEGILCSGLGYDSADVVVITQISDPHCDLGGLDNLGALIRLNAVVANSVRSEGSLVLNADDERCIEIGTQARNRVIYFSMCAENIVVGKHVRAGGQAVVLRQGAGGGLYLFDGRRSTLMFNEDIPARVDERDRSSPAERLAAAAACAGLGIDSTSIGLGLPSLRKGIDYFIAPQPRPQIDTESR
jgi:cyanophycin synthetase